MIIGRTKPNLGFYIKAFMQSRPCLTRATACAASSRKKHVYLWGEGLSGAPIRPSNPIPAVAPKNNLYI
jgi:hypothetical protein